MRDYYWEKKPTPALRRLRRSVRRAILFAFRAIIWLVIAHGIFRLGGEF